MKIVYTIISFFIAISFIFYALSLLYSDQQNFTVHYEIVPLQSLILFLDGDEECVWNLYSSSGYSIGLNDKSFEGIVCLNENKLEKFKEQYDFTKADLETHDSFYEYMKNDNLQWFYSHKLSEDMLSKYLFGELYFEENSNLLYFKINEY